MARGNGIIESYCSTDPTDALAPKTLAVTMQSEAPLTLILRSERGEES